MNKRWKCVFALLTTTLLTVCAFSRFDGSRTGNESQLIMEYDMQENNVESITEEHCESITKADCMILVSKNENLTLSQHGKDDSKEVLAAWEYKEYQSAIMGEAEESSDSISKTALYIINNLN